MEKKYLVKLFFLLFMLHLVSARRVKHNRTSICPRYTFCSCYPEKRNRVDINCFGTRNLEPVYDLLQTEFKNIVVRKLGFRDCYLTSLPSYSFDNCTIQRFSSSCPFSDIEPNAFIGMKSLTAINLENITFPEVPEALKNLQNIETLNISQHRLVSLGNVCWTLPSLKDLGVRFGYLEELSNDTFSGMPNLEALDLGHNKLTYVDPEVLSTLKLLKTISLEYNFIISAENIFNGNDPEVINLKYNNLTSLNNVVHEGMKRLQTLDVSGNTIQEISSSTFGRTLQKLKSFNMAQANCTIINMSFPLQFPRLKTVNLGFNNLRHLPGDLFRSHKNLVTVDLQFNSITCSELLFDNIPRLRTLTLNHNSISAISDCFGSLLVLETLQLSHNKIRRIQDTDFQGLLQIRTLSLAYNHIKFIGSKSFTSLRYLKTLELSHNSISHLNGSLSYVTTVTRLMLNSCNLETVTAGDFFKVRKLTVLHLSSNNLSSVDGVFEYLEELTDLNLANNRLTTISRATFPEKMKLKEISLAQGNKWNCDCRLLWLFDWLSHSNYSVLKDLPSCTLPRNQNGKTFQEVSPKDIRESQDDCPNPCHCTCNPGALLSYLSVDCSKKNISRVPADLPTSPYILDLSENDLKIVNISLGAKELFILNLEHNKIVSLEIGFSPGLKGLRLSDNMLSRPPLVILSKISLQSVTLSRNPWICDCVTISFRDWLVKNRDKVMDLEEIKCGSSSSGEAIYLLRDFDLCSTSLYIGLGVGFTCFVLAFSFVLCLWYRHHLKSLLYARGFKGIKEEDKDTDSDFDGFLSYNWMDEQFVFAQIVPGLQDVQPRFTLSVPNRDVYGEHSNVFISREMKRSKKILILLTENYLRDESSMTEFRIAYNLCFEYKMKSLIFMKNGKIPGAKELDTHVKRALKSTVCVSWGEKFFWERLRYAMPKKVAHLGNATYLQEHPERNEEDPGENATMLNS